MLIDRLGDHRRFGRRRWSVLARHRVRTQRRPRESDPELCPPQAALPGALVVKRGLVVLLEQLEAFVRDGMQPDVIPGAQLLRCAESKGLAGALRLHGQRLQHIDDLVHTQAAMERHGAEMMAM